MDVLHYSEEQLVSLLALAEKLGFKSDAEHWKQQLTELRAQKGN